MFHCAQILDVKEMANVAVKFLDAVHHGLEAGDKKGRNVSQEKLAVLRHLSEGPLATDETSRRVRHDDASLYLTVPLIDSAASNSPRSERQVARPCPGR